MAEDSTGDRTFCGLYPDLDAIFRELWGKLEDAGQRAANGWHLPVIGTLSEKEPMLRTVVLRRADRDSRALLFHTDVRSRKIAELNSHPTVSWLFYDHEDRAQLSIRSTARVHHQDELCTERWENSALTARRCYLAPSPPSRSSDAPNVNLPDALRNRPPSESETEPGFDRFAVVVCEVTAIDWLHLRHTGNERAFFEWVGDDWRNSYLTP